MFRPDTAALPRALQDVWWFCAPQHDAAAPGGGQGGPGGDQLQPAAQGELPAVFPADVEARVPSLPPWRLLSRAQRRGLRASAGRHREAPVRRLPRLPHPNSNAGCPLHSASRSVSAHQQLLTKLRLCQQTSS